MKKLSRMLSLLLSVMLVMSMTGMTALAETAAPSGSEVKDSGPTVGVSNVECTCGAGKDEGHTSDCPLYVEPQEPACAGLEGCGDGVHNSDCPLYEKPAPVTECTCGAAEGEAHTEDCPLYEEPQIIPCSKTEGCILPDGHEGECAVAAAPSGPAKAPALLAAGDPFRIGEITYGTWYEAGNALQDGDTLELLEDVSWDYQANSALPEGTVIITSAKADGSKARITMDVTDIKIDDRQKKRTAVFTNVIIDGTDANNSIRVGNNGTVVFDDGTEVVGFAETAVSSYYSSAGTVVMKDGASITGCGLAVEVDCGLTFRMEGGSIAGNYNDYHYASGIVFTQGTLEISGNAQVTGNTIKGYDENYDPIEETWNANVYVGPGQRMDLTGLSSDAQIGLFFDPSEPASQPTADTPVPVALITGEEIPAGVALDMADSPYALEPGKKLDAGVLYLIDPNGTPSATLRGNGTENDPFLVKSLAELTAVVNKINGRSQMNFVKVDGPFSLAEARDDIPTLTGRMTLYSDAPQTNKLTVPIAAMYVSGNPQLVLKDIVFEGALDAYYSSILDTIGMSAASGGITIEDGAVFTGLTNTLFDVDSCDVTVNGGSFTNSKSTIIHTEGAITINGGTFSNLGGVASLGSPSTPAIRLGGDYTFSGNTQDFYLADSYPAVVLTSPLNSSVSVYAANNRKIPVFTAEDPAWLTNWESKLTEIYGAELELSQDGKSIMIKGADRQKVSFPRYWNDSTYGSLPQGKYYNAGTDTIRLGGFYTNGNNSMSYNGYDAKVQFTKVLMAGPDGKPLANFKDSAGEEMTDANGYITNWDSVDLEYYATLSVDGEAIKVTGSNGVIDNIPAQAGAFIHSNMRYKGNDQYLPCDAYDVCSVYGYELMDSPFSPQAKLKEGVTVTTTNNSVEYTGEEVHPTVEVTVQRSDLMDGQKITLVEGQDFWLGINEEDWEIGDNRTAYLYFSGNFAPGYGSFAGYPISFSVTKGSLTAEDYPVVVPQDAAGTQTVDLSQLAVTPVQTAYTYTLGIVEANTILDNIAVSGSNLTFTLKQGGTAGVVEIPINIDSANAAGAGKVVVTVSAKTEGPVVLQQAGNSYYFDTISDALVYAKDGDKIILGEVIAEDNLVIDKAVFIDGGKTGGISGTVAIAAEVQLKDCNLSSASVSLAEGGADAVLTPNYWNGNSPKAVNAERTQLYPYYKDAAMTILVADPAIAVDAAIAEADELIFNRSEDLVSLRDIKTKMDDPDVQSFLRSHKDDFKAILDDLYATADPDALDIYLTENPEEKELLDLLLLAYDIACQVVPKASEPSAENATSNATSEEGKAAVDSAKNDITTNDAVSSFIPVFGGGVTLDNLAGVTDTTQAVYLIVDVSTEEIKVDETINPPVISSLTFEVSAQYSVTSEDEGFSPLPNTHLKGNVSFRLPIPQSVMQTYAKVEHVGDKTQYLTIQISESGAKYIDMSVSHFSPFIVSFTNTKPSEGGSHGSGGSDDGDSHDDRNYDFWMDVKDKISDADSGDVIKVNAKNYDKMPYSVMTELRKNSDVSLVIRWNGGEDIVIPAGQAQPVESMRIYYPLSLLEELYKGKTLTDPVTGKPIDPSKLNPETGGVLKITAPAVNNGGAPEVTDPQRGLAETPELAERSVEKAIPGVFEPEETPAVPAGSNNILFALLAAIGAAAVAGVCYWKKRHA